MNMGLGDNKYLIKLIRNWLASGLLIFLCIILLIFLLLTLSILSFLI